jgi:hypothetical protein
MDNAAMDKLNSQNILTDATLPKGEARKIDWAVVVVVLAALSTVAWTYALLLIFIQIARVAIS